MARPRWLTSILLSGAAFATTSPYTQSAEPSQLRATQEITEGDKISADNIIAKLEDTGYDNMLKAYFKARWGYRRAESEKRPSAEREATHAALEIAIEELNDAHSDLQGIANNLESREREKIKKLLREKEKTLPIAGSEFRIILGLDGTRSDVAEEVYGVIRDARECLWLLQEAEQYIESLKNPEDRRRFHGTDTQRQRAEIDLDWRRNVFADLIMELQGRFLRDAGLQQKRERREPLSEEEELRREYAAAMRVGVADAAFRILCEEYANSRLDVGGLFSAVGTGLIPVPREEFLALIPTPKFLEPQSGDKRPSHGR